MRQGGNNSCGGDQPQQESEAGLEQIGKTAAHGENRKPQQSQPHIQQLRDRTPLHPQQDPCQRGEEELQRNGRRPRRQADECAYSGQRRKQGGQEHHAKCFV